MKSQRSRPTWLASFLRRRTGAALRVGGGSGDAPDVGLKTTSTMNPATLSALAALSGSAVGGLTSFLSSWIGQSAQLRSQVFLNDKSRRQELYREFVDEASKSYID